MRLIHAHLGNTIAKALSTASCSNEETTQSNQLKNVRAHPWWTNVRKTDFSSDSSSRCCKRQTTYSGRSSIDRKTISRFSFPFSLIRCLSFLRLWLRRLSLLRRLWRRLFFRLLSLPLRRLASGSMFSDFSNRILWTKNAGFPNPPGPCLYHSMIHTMMHTWRGRGCYIFIELMLKLKHSQTPGPSKRATFYGAQHIFSPAKLFQNMISKSV